MFALPKCAEFWAPPKCGVFEGWVVAEGFGAGKVIAQASRTRNEGLQEVVRTWIQCFPVSDFLSGRNPLLWPCALRLRGTRRCSASRVKPQPVVSGGPGCAF